MCALTFTARKIAPLVRMLGSPVDGEAPAACRAIGRTLDSVGRDFHDLAAVNRGGADPQGVILYCERDLHGETEPEPCRVWHDLARRLEHFGDLRPVERCFLRDIKRWRGEPTPKQMRWLLAIAEALGVDRRVS